MSKVTHFLSATAVMTGAVMVLSHLHRLCRVDGEFKLYVGN
jgi:hypothetical protein